MEEYFLINEKRWNELAPIHEKSEYYSLEEFKKGKSSLMKIEQSELTDISGKRLLHLMCHIGLDTLSLARDGAIVTGVDFSEKSISIAEKISQELDIKCDFVCCNVYDSDKFLDKKFDIIFSSYGILCWLPDLFRWAKIIFSLLEYGGYFYIVELHPFSDMFEINTLSNKLEVNYSYFNPGSPYRIIREQTYADRSIDIHNKILYRWPHGFDEIINSFINAGFSIEFVHEFPYCSYHRFPGMIQSDNGYWVFEDKNINIPLTFSLKAVKNRETRI